MPCRASSPRSERWRDLGVKYFARDAIMTFPDLAADLKARMPDLRGRLMANQPLKELFSPSDWPMFRGTANRTAQGIGGSPFMPAKSRKCRAISDAE